MEEETEITLSGPFEVKDRAGITRAVSAIRIFDEGYGLIDVYVYFSEDGLDLHEDPVVLKAILARLRTLGYSGPDFGLGDPGLQDERLMVLEASEEFGPFAVTKGWRDLSHEFDEPATEAALRESLKPGVAPTLLDALMQKFKAS